jgi:hypothetical protein
MLFDGRRGDSGPRLARGAIGDPGGTEFKRGGAAVGKKVPIRRVRPLIGIIEDINEIARRLGC